MDVNDAPAPLPQHASPARPWRDWQYLALLLVLALAIRVTVIATTTVPARDSIGFLRIALRFEKEPYANVVKSNHQHPGFPLLLLVVSWPIRALYGATNSVSMQLSAQAASALAGWLLVIPMYYLGRRLHGRAVAFWGSLLYQCLPGGGQLLSDGVSDPLYLLLLTTALLSGMWALSGTNPRRYALTGALVGLAYFVRPEGALVLLLLLAFLTVRQLRAAWRQPWPLALKSAAALTVGALIAGSPYYLATGAFSLKPTTHQLTGREVVWLEAADKQLALSPPIVSRLFAVHLDKGLPWSERIPRGVTELLGEFAHGYQYLGTIPLAFGVCWFGRRYLQSPATLLLVSFVCVHALLLWWLAMCVAYVSDRHVQPIVLCSVFLTVAAARVLPLRLWRWRGWPSTGLFWRASVWSLVLLLTLTGMGLARTLRPLHGHRVGHHAAGRWLAEHSQPCDVIEDEHAWAHYYAGRVFLEGKQPPCPPGHVPLRYYVIGRASERRPPSHRTEIRESDLLAARAELVYRWPPTAAVEQARVLVYAISQKRCPTRLSPLDYRPHAK